MGKSRSWRMLNAGWLLGLGAIGLSLGSSGCKQEDVAPQQARSADALTDAAGKAPAGDSGASGAGEGAGEKVDGKSADSMGSGGPGGAPAGGASDAPPVENPEPGKPDQPPPPAKGTDGLPPPSGDDIPMGSAPLPEGVKGVKIKGSVTFKDYKAGHIQIDVADRGMNGGGRGAQPKIIQLYRMEKPGAFEIDVPAGQGSVFLSAYNDENQDGKPEREEPRGSASGNPYTIKDVDLTGVELTLAREKIPAPP